MLATAKTELGNIGLVTDTLNRHMSRKTILHVGSWDCLEG